MSDLEMVYSLVPEFTEWLADQEMPKGAGYVAPGDSASALGERVKKYAKQNRIQIPKIRPLDHDTAWELYFANEVSGSILQRSVVGATIYFLEDFAKNAEKVWNFYRYMDQNLELTVVFTIMIASPFADLPKNTRVWRRDEDLASLLNAKYDRRRREPKSFPW